MTDIAPTTVLAPSSGHEVRPYLKGTMIDSELALNEVASRVFSLIDGRREVAEIAAMVQAEYDVDLKTCLADVTQLAQDLVDEDLVVVLSPAP